MATYVSATNPFVEIESDSGNKPQISSKNAPGMARPHKLKLDHQNNNSCSKADQLAQLKSGNCCSSKIDSTQDQAYTLDTLGWSDGESKKTEEIIDNGPSSPNSYINDQSKDLASCLNIDSDVEVGITETCRDLVEAAASLSMVDEEDSANKESQAKSTSTSTSDYQEEVEHDDEDEDKINEELVPKAPAARDSRHYHHIELIKKLRLQLRDLERYAYERGELGEQVPVSVLAERQNVVIETLKKKLSLNLDQDKIEKLELEELKEQVDKEIDDLIDPLKTKEQLLNQLRTQLTDLERYVTHLHETLGHGRDGGISSLTNDDSSGSCFCHKQSACLRPKSTASHHHTLTLRHEAFDDGLLRNDSLPRTSSLIRGLIAQLICSDLKIQETMKKAESGTHKNSAAEAGTSTPELKKHTQQQASLQNQRPVTRVPQFHDGATWTLHLDKVILATDSLVNLFSSDQSTYVRPDNRSTTIVDEALVESIVRRQLVPALRDLLSYGLIDPSCIPKPNPYNWLLFDPYHLLSSLTCLPGFSRESPPAATHQLQKQTHQQQLNSDADFNSLRDGKIHIWEVITDYYTTRSDTDNFKQSSIKTLSQSFQLTPSMQGPIKITSKQALLISVEDVIVRMSKCRPNGPESRFKMLVYIALNLGKLATWLRIVFKNRAVIKKYYHNFSFVSQPEKIDRFLTVVDGLTKMPFKLSIVTDCSVADQFSSEFQLT